ncbi:class I SAM-dependent methyltransferase [Blastopirellula retiformator]|uniref:Demethylrebeccamycin-D-glucose O-methyltransferase n=1 Tax=Blastopirellula retiformator TaxID=2527970 RepID=A0A5C5V8H8_9BACT|nr:class I SAM-dependent methyltransferase [Blastopirellula retiformator]TWT34868.1 Demethylrebeccamycin-D-glucose O-methyltransferase [Blastopirellula retiformator]
MALFARPSAERIIHDQQLYEQPEFAAEYNTHVGKTNPDFKPPLKYLTQNIQPTQALNVLEIGPGPGWIGIQLAQLRPAVQVTGIDVSAAFVEIANENSRREGVDDRATFTLGNAADMRQFADASFDIVYSFQSLHYWDPPEQALDEIARVLKPNGLFWIGDDRRDMNWIGKSIMLIGRMFLSQRIWSVWTQSVHGCLTSEEAIAAIQGSALRDRWQIAILPRAIVLTSKPPG